MRPMLVGAQAIALRHPSLAAPPAAPWEVWIAHEAVRSQARALHFEHDPASGDEVACVDAGARRYRFTLLRADDARRRFMAADAHESCMAAAGGMITIASSVSLALIERAQLYRSEQWHCRIAAYHRLRALQAAAGVPTDEGVSAAEGIPTDKGLSTDEGAPTDESGAEPRGAARLSGAEPAAHRAAFDALREQVLAAVDAKRFDMRVSNEAFFGTYRNAWLRWHPHDELHRATCYGATPLYETLKEDLSLAYVPRAGFEALPPADQLRLVREECYALALERVLVPAEQLGVDFSEALAFQVVLRRLCTDLARGWFRDFAIDQYPAIIDYDLPFWQRFCRARQRGELAIDAAAAAMADRPERLRAYWNDERERDRQAGLLPA